MTLQGLEKRVYIKKELRRLLEIKEEK